MFRSRRSGLAYISVALILGSNAWLKGMGVQAWGLLCSLVSEWLMVGSGELVAIVGKQRKKL